MIVKELKELLGYLDDSLVIALNLPLTYVVRMAKTAKKVLTTKK